MSESNAWLKDLSKKLPQSSMSCGAKYNVVDLFAGCGGLALGFKAAGFTTVGYEIDPIACSTYEKNLNDPCYTAELKPGFELPNCDVLIGGPPCQPFSVGGKQNGLNDARDGFPAFLDAVDRLRPKLALIENVRGLLYKNKWYLEQINDRLISFGYEVHCELLNAKFYDVPQNRQRVIVVATKLGWAWPKQSNRIVTAGEALGSMGHEYDDDSFFLTPNIDAYIARYEAASKCINPRDLYLDRPARTLTCRNLHGRTGDMHRIALPDGRRRTLTVREAARLQSFPDWFEFEGRESKKFDQIGNAVAPLFAYSLAKQVFKTLDGNLDKELASFQQNLFEMS